MERQILRKLTWHVLSASLFWAAAVPLPLHAQSGKGVLSGVVVSRDGAPVAAAHVFFQSADGTAPHVMRTDAKGRFHSGLLRAGLYEVRAEAGGRWSEWAHNVTVSSGGGEHLTLRLARRTAPQPPKQ